tara:strand:- start:1802 stop:2149 length:348 start_codon:yes stop_codon:yes gene_type:complete
MSLQNNIRDLIHFYIRTNYNKYLEDNNIKSIDEDKIEGVVNNLYTDRKEHLQVFIKSSLKQILKEEYPGDQTVQNLLLNILQDDELCKNRIIVEIKLYQQKINKGVNNYSNLIRK